MAQRYTLRAYRQEARKRGQESRPCKDTVVLSAKEGEQGLGGFRVRAQ